jgi:hypothetical protein
VLFEFKARGISTPCFAVIECSGHAWRVGDIQTVKRRLPMKTVTRVRNELYREKALEIYVAWLRHHRRVIPAEVEAMMKRRGVQ